MTDRELIGVFWATFAAIPVILLIVWGVNRGLDQQERAERLETIEGFAADLASSQVEPSAEEWAAVYQALEHSSTAVETADQPRASDSPRRGGGTSFQEEER